MAKLLGILLVLVLAVPSVGLVTRSDTHEPGRHVLLRLQPARRPDPRVTDHPDPRRPHVTLNRQQLTHAATIITVGAQTPGVGRAGVLVALMAALTESTLRMLANRAPTRNRSTYPNDGDGSDHDSLGIFQMRPAAGWGTRRRAHGLDYQARAFFGGPSGPNGGSPRGAARHRRMAVARPRRRCAVRRSQRLPRPLPELSARRGGDPRRD